ncbi:GNAT family N-acetyltransferase [Gulosibacter sp. 10]|uniref:GNAT family N-acetyltransferase n=1 Tax=Gulosibacter sp. 10 TaxID=1255570 RepID=UPI00097F5AB7|nr:hypothetical protein FM112_03910 [Gulosibacter sp. 10]
MSEAATETAKADYDFSKDPGHHRYVVHYDGDIVGFTTYRELGDGVHFDHTVVDSAHQGGGVASRLVRFALDDFAQWSRMPMIPDCSYVAKWVENHPDYAHLLSARG